MIVLFSFESFAQKENFLTYNSGNGFTVPVVPSHEFGVFAGIAYYIGELNRGGHFNPHFLHPAAGLIYRYNLNGRYSLKFAGIYGRISGDDAMSSNIFEQERNLNFVSPLIEGSGEIEFNYFHFNPTDNKSYVTPYVFTGIAGFWYNPSDKDGNQISPGDIEGVKPSRIQPSIPFGTGIKAKFSQRILLSLEWGLRKTFTDYIDDVSTRYINSNMQRGNSKNKDWYSFAGLSLTIRTSKNPGTCPRKLIGK